MDGDSNFWTADTVSAAAAALSVVLAAVIFAVDRVSAWTRRRADASRLLKLIAGDLGLALAKLRSVSAQLNSSAAEAGHGSAEILLIRQPGSEGALEMVLRGFDTARLDRICETTNVFDPVTSDRLSSVITLRAASLESVQILAATEDQAERAGIASHVCIQANALQMELLSVFNAVVASRGETRLQQAALISIGQSR